MVSGVQEPLNESVYTALDDLGLSQAEKQLYTVSLQIGPSPIASLAKHLVVSRPNVYKTIRALEKRGLVNAENRAKYARSFVVEPPTKVLELLRGQQKHLDMAETALASSMPSLLAHYQQGAARSKVKIFEGRDQFFKLFFQVLDEAKEQIEFFGSADAFIGMISWETERQWIKQRVERGIHINVVLTPGKDADTLKTTDATEMRTTKIFQGQSPIVTGFMLYANKVILWQPQAPLAIVIEDIFLVQMLRAVFYNMWESSK